MNSSCKRHRPARPGFVGVWLGSRGVRAVGVGTLAAWLHLYAATTTVAQNELPVPTDRVKIDGVSTNGFVHPGIGMTKEILENARKQVLAGREPWYSGYVTLASSPNSSKNVKCRNQSPTDPGKPDIDAFDSRNMDARLKQDAYKARQQALMYFFTGEDVYRANAMNIVRVWSHMDRSKFKNYSEAHIHASYPVQDMVMAAELLRYTSTGDAKLAWTDEDTKNFTMNFALPAMKTFFDENGWFMNQNGYPLAAAMSVDIFTNDRERYERRVEWFTVNKTAPNKGWSSSILHLARLVDTNALTGEKVANPVVQLMEMGRDQAHAGGDVDIFANTARMMNAQRTKVDPLAGTISTKPDAVGPYEFLDDRILAAADQFCRFMLGYETPWIPAAYDIGPNGETRAIYPRIADNYRGRIRGLDFWDMYYYYACNKGVDVAKKAPYYHEAFSKRIVNSVTDWIYIPASVSGEGARVPQREQEPAVVQIELRSTLFTPASTIVKDRDTSFVRVIPSSAGTRIAILSCDTDRKTIGLRVRTTGPAEIAMSGLSKPWLLPDTQGQWRNVTYTMGSLERFRDIVYFSIKASPETRIDLDNLQRKLDDKVAPLAFTGGNADLSVVAYVGAPVQLDFGSTAKGNATITSSDKPREATLNASTGAFAWRPGKDGEYSFIVNLTSGDAIAGRRVRIIVAPDRDSAVRQIESRYNKGERYVEASLVRFRSLQEKITKLGATTSDESFYSNLAAFQQAADTLQLLTPRLADGSIDYPGLVATSNIGESIGLLTDGNDDTFPVYTLAKELNYLVDFGSGHQISASAFALEGRLNFENRTLDTVFFGSNDGEKWTQLTAALEHLPTELTRIEVSAEGRNERFRYLKIQKVSRKSSPLFEPSELRIFGERYERN